MARSIELRGKITTYQSGLLYVAVFPCKCSSLLPLPENIVCIGSGHGLHDVGRRQETHEGESDDEKGSQDQSGLSECQRESKGPYSNHKVEDVRECKLHERDRAAYQWIF